MEITRHNGYIYVYALGYDLGTVDTTFVGIKRIVLTAVLVTALTIIAIMSSGCTNSKMGACDNITACYYAVKHCNTVSIGNKLSQPEMDYCMESDKRLALYRVMHSR